MKVIWVRVEDERANEVALTITETLQFCALPICDGPKIMDVGPSGLPILDDGERTNKAAANGTLLSAKTPSEAAALVAVFFPDKSKE